MMTLRAMCGQMASMLRIGFLACLGALVLSGCGGSSTPAVTPATTAAAAQNARLTEAQWASYVDERDKAREINAAATKTFAVCNQLILTSAPAEKVNACLGDSTASVVTAGKAVLVDLDALAGETSGACEAANVALAGYVKLYTASVQSLGVSVERGDLASGQTSIDNSREALKNTKAASAAFDSACKPR